jgi:monoamine oxidase
VRFVPDLTDKWRGTEALKMGTVVKLLLRFRDPVWEDAALGEFGFLHTPQEPFLAWWTTRPMRTGVLTAWAGGPAAGRLAGKEPRALVETALESLSRSLSFSHSRLSELLEAWHIADWQHDPFSRGAYSYVGVGGLEAPQRLAEPVADTLYFAGEATHESLSGTVGGALESGERAAEEVLRRLSLT